MSKHLLSAIQEHDESLAAMASDTSEGACGAGSKNAAAQGLNDVFGKQVSV